MKVPFLDLSAGYRELKEELDAAYHRVMTSGRYVLGEEVAAFEEEFAVCCGARYCIGLGSGLDAVRLALQAYEIGPGDEVLVPANTFIATWLAVSAVGALPVPVEPDPATFNMDPVAAGAAITARTRAIVPVHLYGQPADMNALMGLARRHGLRVIEDAAQAQGAAYKRQRVGGLGDCAAFSFYPAKNLGAFGDAGAVVTGDADIAQRIRILGNYGSRVKYENEVRGCNSRLDPLQAAFLRVKLRHLDEWNRRRQRAAERYTSQLGGWAELTLPAVPAFAEPVWHQYVVRHAQRDALAGLLAAAGVETAVHYPVPPHLSGAYADSGRGPGDFPLAERMADTVLSLPIGPHLGECGIALAVAGLKKSLQTLRSQAAGKRLEP